MKTFTSTELRRESSAVYNEVQEKGSVSIVHRDRPMMVLITVKALDKITRLADKK
jgi:prevent-host-death family protein